MGNKKPTLTQGARELLEEVKLSIDNRIINIAERRALDKNRREINEEDVLYARASILVKSPSSHRKWAIRTLIFVTFALLGIQVSAFYQLLQFLGSHELSVVIQALLLIPIIFILALMIFFTWIFREDWL